jgi:hypothetical protein
LQNLYVSDSHARSLPPGAPRPMLRKPSHMAQIREWVNEIEVRTYPDAMDSVGLGRTLLVGDGGVGGGRARGRGPRCQLTTLLEPLP